MPLLTRFRQGFREDRTLQEAPAQVIDAGSLEDGQSLVVLNCLFLWDCWFLSASGEYAFFSATTNGAKSIRGPNQLAADWPTA